MTRIIAVIGATGSQGGGVVSMMNKTPGWQVRAITRNSSSEKAKALRAEGVEVVQASFDDEESLLAAFKGAHAIFAMTDFWERFIAGIPLNEASALEEEDGMTLARAAARTPSLEHYIWSTSPGARRQLKGELVVPHMDAKSNVDHRIRSELPELAAKTTYLYSGYYAQNLFQVSFYKPVEFPAGSGEYIQLVPGKAGAKVLMAGDITANLGIWVRQVLTKGPSTFGKYSNVALEKLTGQEMATTWSEVMGRKLTYVPCSIETFESMFGTAGFEIGLQFEFTDRCDPWKEGPQFIGVKELDLDVDEVVGFRQALEKYKHLVVV